jgi:hypothetical protein
MSTGKEEKASAQERWGRIVREAYAVPDEGAKDALEAPREEVRRELEEAGFDLAEEEALARNAHEAFLAARRAKAPDAPASEGDLAGGKAEGWVADAAPSNVVPLTPRKRTARWLVTTLVAAAATGGTIFAVARHSPPPPEEPTPPPPKTPEPPPVVDEPVPVPAPTPPPAPREEPSKGPKAPPRHSH